MASQYFKDLLAGIVSASDAAEASRAWSMNEMGEAIHDLSLVLQAQQEVDAYFKQATAQSMGDCIEHVELLASMGMALLLPSLDLSRKRRLTSFEASSTPRQQH